jgi:hypothetical protein
MACMEKIRHGYNILVKIPEERSLLNRLGVGGEESNY